MMITARGALWPLKLRRMQNTMDLYGTFPTRPGRAQRYPRGPAARLLARALKCETFFIRWLLMTGLVCAFAGKRPAARSGCVLSMFSLAVSMTALVLGS